MVRIFGFVSIMGMLVVTTTASAQGLDPELTIRPMPDPAQELPASVVELLALPDSASSIAMERSAVALARANENRARAGENRAQGLARAAERRAAGLETAAEARERGAELGADVADAARGVRESLVRGDGEIDLPIPVDLPQLPDHLSDRPDVPTPSVELPDRPALPEQAGRGA